MYSNKEIKELVKLHKTPTLFLSREAISKAYTDLQSALPNVKLYYALKANSHPEILKILNKLGAGFDVCSNGEIDKIKRTKISTEHCIHTHPIKSEDTISYAYQNGIKTFVVDGFSELEKLILYKGDIRVLIRIAIENPAVKTDFSKKFGVTSTVAAINLIKEAVSLGFKNIGISFHCGSQSAEPEIFCTALLKSKKIISALKRYQINISILDIGGGFPHHDLDSKYTITDYCKTFTPLLQEIGDLRIEIIAEPGRFIASNAMKLITEVVNKSERNGKTWYYINESVYNSFSGQIFDYMHYPFSCLDYEEQNAENLSVIAGETCDSIDVIRTNVLLPNLPIGALFLFHKMGAYTSESASNFNGFEKTKIVVINQF